jgi:hypothetical protein
MDDTFTNVLEFGSAREFAISDGKGFGGEIVFTANVVWDEEELKKRVIVQQQGIYLGEVLCFIKKSYFPNPPRAEEIIYHPITPFKKGWRIVMVEDTEHVYQLYLDKLIG